jgi:hypothetical protein
MIPVMGTNCILFAVRTELYVNSYMSFGLERCRPSGQRVVSRWLPAEQMKSGAMCSLCMRTGKTRDKNIWSRAGNSESPSFALHNKSRYPNVEMIWVQAAITWVRCTDSVHYVLDLLLTARNSDKWYTCRESVSNIKSILSKQDD